MPSPVRGSDEEVTTAQACVILGGAPTPLTRSTVIRMVQDGILVPSRKLGPRTAAYLFWLSDVEALRDQRAERAVS